jgi:hypothetical protein
VVVVAMNISNLQALAVMREMLTFVFNNITSYMMRFCYFINSNMTIAAMFEADYSNQTDSQPRDVYLSYSLLSRKASLLPTLHPHNIDLFV